MVSADSDPAWLQFAIKEIGVKELTGRNDGKRIIDYFEIAGFPHYQGIPWCAAFTGAALKYAGCNMTGLNAMARSFLLCGPSVPYAARGAVAVLKSNRGINSGHVGFVVGRTKDMVQLIGGNQSNAVSSAWFPINRVIGYHWPRNIKGLWPVSGSRLLISQSHAGDNSGIDA